MVKPEKQVIEMLMKVYGYSLMKERAVYTWYARPEDGHERVTDDARNCVDNVTLQRRNRGTSQQR